jgi:hypothetical protein
LTPIGANGKHQPETKTNMLNFKNVLNPVVTTANQICGTLPDGAAIEVSRVQNGWSVQLQVEINGVIYHKNAPSAAERVAFDDLADRAWKDADARRENQGNAARASGRFLTTV